MPILQCRLNEEKSPSIHKCRQFLKQVTLDDNRTEIQIRDKIKSIIKYRL